MNKLLKLITDNQADILPATEEQIAKAESVLGLTFTKEYRSYLLNIGVISFGAVETYGLGIPDTSFLNIVNALDEFRALENFPTSLIPIADIGDGHYYMYDNYTQNIVIVALPGVGIKIICSDLESFFIDLIFN
ncbi:SMI1/KNR4 family protein [Pseudoalteromonas sp. MB41]|uniref:SMI1/KNR4 family protein n=1 Tax=Pseudoalteromonas sp. MB41 TaxID=2896366 RepID=UPI001E30D486|nr:SMI1/KNR4 family protein [Pseudoalteromonas sp. MB41]MCC9661492.1 SMI1/KNR4 family protein [Pseudoalteromonas sp. MB41]